MVVSRSSFAISTGVYSFLLQAHPRRFRTRFKADMVSDFRDICRSRAASKPLFGRASAWLLVLKDLAVSVPRQHLYTWKRRQHLKRMKTARHERRQAFKTNDIGGAPYHGEPRRSRSPGRIVDMITQDIQFALRTLRKQPSFTVVAILTLGLGIGATSAIFSVLDAVVLQPLPYSDPDGLVRFMETTPEGWDFSTSEPNFIDYRTQSTSFTDMAAFTFLSFGLLGEGEPTQISANPISASAFGLLGAKPLLGRTFTDAEDRPGGDTRVVLLSEAMWRERYGADEGVIGRKLILDGAPYVVVGVMPASFDFPSDPDVWMPLAPDPGENRGDHRLMAIARLKPGVSNEQAHADLEAIGARLGEQFPDSNGGWSARLEPFDEWLIGSQVTQAMYVLLAAVGLLLLIACANVSNLLLARATTRRREIGLRAALGAGRGRLVRQLLVESLVLGLLGAGLGLLLAYWALPLIRGLGPMGIPRIEEVELNGLVVLFTFVVSMLTGIVFGLVPAVQISRGSLQEALQEGGRVAESGSRRLRHLMVVGELALAVMVLIGAGLLINSFQRLQRTDPGFVAEGVLTVPVSLTGEHYTPEMQGQFITDVFEGIGALPGVTAIGATNISPFAGGSTAIELTVEGREVLSGEDYPFAAWRAVTPGFFESLGITLKMGRFFSFEEDWGRPREFVVINETLATQLWPDGDPLGQRIGLGRNEYENLSTVVGVVGDIVDTRLESDPGPMIFLPYTGGWPWMTLLVRTSGDPALLTAAVREQIWAVDKNLPLPGIVPLVENMSGAVAGPRFNMQLMGIFAMVALLLAAVGVYGIMAFAVARRTREIGVRMALGAQPGKLVAMVIGQALKVAGFGVALGLLGAFWLSRFLETLLYETTPTDTLTYVAVALILLAVATVAALLPALRATRVDPKVALTTE